MPRQTVETRTGVVFERDVAIPKRERAVELPYLTPSLTVLSLLDRVGSLSGVEIRILADTLASDAKDGRVESLLSVASRAGIVERAAQNVADSQAHMRGRPFFSEAQVKGRALRRLERDPILDLVGLQSDEESILLALRELCSVGQAAKKEVVQQGDYEVYYFPLGLGSAHVEAIRTQFVHMDWEHHRNPLIVVRPGGLDLYERPMPRRRWPWTRG